MAKVKVENVVTLSLLDRLCDLDEWPSTRQHSLRLYRESIKRDVEALLNSRRPPIAGLQRYPRAAASVMNYGLPDIHSYSDSATDQASLANALVQTLRRFEPRLRNVRVSLVRSESLNRSLRFHVEGRLQLDTTLELIEFDTVLELARGGYEVK